MESVYGSSKAGWKRISRHRALQKGVNLLRTKGRDNVEAVNTAGWPLDKPGKVDMFYGLLVNFYSLKTKKILARRIALNDGLGATGWVQGWAFLPNLGSGSWPVKIKGLWAMVAMGFRQFCRWPWFWAPLLWSWCKALHLWPWDRIPQNS